MKFVIYLMLLTSAVFARTAAAVIAAKPALATAQTDWTKVAIATPEGGFAMGNPKAKVHIIEYASYSCPHCSKFHSDSAKGLDSYMRSGQVQFEFRSFLIHGPLDVVPSMVTYCQTPQRFFALTNVFYNHWDEWVMPTNTKLTAVTPAEQEAVKGKAPILGVQLMGKKSGLSDFLRKHGFPEAQFNKCMSNQKTLDTLQNTMKTSAKYEVQSTPTFIINGEKLEITPGTEPWLAVETRIKALK